MIGALCRDMQIWNALGGALNIDQSFVSEIHDEHGHYPVILAIIAIAYHLPITLPQFIAVLREQEAGRLPLRRRGRAGGATGVMHTFPAR